MLGVLPNAMKIPVNGYKYMNSKKMSKILCWLE
jgi:hypothetical protein